jgi:hypothetical protein
MPHRHYEMPQVSARKSHKSFSLVHNKPVFLLDARLLLYLQEHKI